MTLKEFAETAGINYQTAKTWLSRGKIERVAGGGFRLAETSEITLKPEPEIETLKPETVAETCARCETLAAQVAALADRVTTLEAEAMLRELAGER